MRLKSKAAAGGAIIALVAGLATLSSVAAAWSPPGQVPDVIQPGDFRGPEMAPREWVDEFTSCPKIADFPADVRPVWCVKLNAYDGELKLGKTVAKVSDPISLTIGIGLRVAEPVIVMPEGGGGSPSAVKIPGGILGQPGLDPIIDADPLGLLSVSATPQMGAAGVVGDPVSFLSWTGSATPGDETVALQVPLSIKLNNALFGDQCEIPEFNIVLSNNGDPGQHIYADYRHTTNVFNAGAIQTFVTRLGVNFADESFAVQGADNCDFIQPVHDVVRDTHGELGPLLSGLGLGAPGDALEETTDSLDGLFDPVINSQVGLPASSGNYARFKVDTVYSPYHGGVIQGRLTPQGAGFGVPGPAALPSTAVGATTDVPVTLTNVGLPNRFRVEPLTTAESANFELLDPNGCSEKLLDTRESCDLTLRFAPTSTGTKTVNVRTWSGILNSGTLTSTFRGNAG